MVKRAQSRAAPAHRRKVPDSDMAHLEYTLASYVENVGLLRAFDLGPYKTMFKACGVKRGAL
eukprot:11956632-Heterocapsa_arctica.AAC.1